MTINTCGIFVIAIGAKAVFGFSADGLEDLSEVGYFHLNYYRGRDGFIRPNKMLNYSNKTVILKLITCLNITNYD